MHPRFGTVRSEPNSGNHLLCTVPTLQATSRTGCCKPMPLFSWLVPLTQIDTNHPAVGGSAASIFEWKPCCNAVGMTKLIPIALHSYPFLDTCGTQPPTSTHLHFHTRSHRVLRCFYLYLVSTRTQLSLTVFSWAGSGKTRCGWRCRASGLYQAVSTSGHQHLMHWTRQ